MDARALYTIGEVAKLFHMNIRTLRYYDQLGILKPEFINDETNYRYYSTDQFERLNTIRYLRALDVPLAKIAGFFEVKDANATLEMFIDQRETVREKQEQLRKIESKITRRIEQLETAIAAEPGKIIVKTLPKRRVVTFEKTFTYQEDLEPLIRNISKEHALDDAIFLGKVGTAVSKQDLEKGRFSNYSSIFVIVEPEDEVEYCDDILKAGSYATVQFLGTHKDAPPYYKQLKKYLQKEGHKIAGDSVEITTIDAGMTNDTSKFVTELQIPYQK